jgi:hypothetical protein
MGLGRICQVANLKGIAKPLSTRTDGEELPISSGIMRPQRDQSQRGLRAPGRRRIDPPLG